MISALIALVILIIAYVIEKFCLRLIPSNTYKLEYIGSGEIAPIPWTSLKISIPTGQINYFNETLPKYIYAENQHGFNMALIPFKDKYVCAVRLFFTIKGLVGEPIVPGNKPHHKHPTKHPGSNFIWSSWKSKSTVDTTVYFMCDYAAGEITPLGAPVFIHNVDTFHKEVKGFPFSLSDMRLFVENNRLYTYDGFITMIKDIDVKSDPMNKLTYMNTNVCNQAASGYNKKYDKNWSYWRGDDKQFEFMHWFEEDGVYSVIVPKNYNLPCQKVQYVKFMGEPVPPLGNQKLPMFSFGVPFVKIADNTWLSVGHTKIMTTFAYSDTSKVHNWRKEIVKEFSAESNYVEHSSYIYLGYFILLRDNKMFISDSFLPRPSNTQYLFSIFFPMSIFIQNEKVVVAGGYGDYYNMILTFSEDEVLKSCIHDVEHFVQDNYDYHIITT